MANIIVDIFTDENDGAGVGLGTSLREAIFTANTNGDAENTITLAAGNYVLDVETANPALIDDPNNDFTTFGDLDIFDGSGAGKTLTITGAGAEQTTITANFSATDRVFQIFPGVTLNMSGVTVTGGNNASETFLNFGGGFLVGDPNFVDLTNPDPATYAANASAILNLSDSTVTGNSADNGAGILVFGGQANVANTTVADNTAAFDSGGIGAIFGATLNITDSLVSGNTADRNGGGVANATTSNTSIANTTIINNSALGLIPVDPIGPGGGVFLNDGSIDITGSFIAGNNAVLDGGGVSVLVDTVTITDTIITGNTSDSDADGLGDGGGVANIGGTVNIGNTAVLGGTVVGNFDTPNNAGPGTIFPNLFGEFTSTGNNAIGDAVGSTGLSFESGDFFSIGPSSGVALNLVNSFAFESGDGIAFDSVSGNLFGLQTILTDPSTFQFDSDVIEIGTDGTIIEGGGFAFSDTLDASGIDALPDGTFLVASLLEPSIRQYNPDGTLVEGGIDFTPSVPVVSTVFNRLTGTIYGTDFFNGTIVQFDQSGNLLSELDLNTIFPDGVSVQGLAINPFNGNFFVADDTGAPSPNTGNSSIYEISRSGELISTFDLVELTGNPAFADPEGLTFDFNTGDLYVVFDDDDPENVGDLIGVFQVDLDPLDSYLIDQNEEFSSRPLVTVGESIPLLEGEFPFLQTVSTGIFPVDNLGEVDDGDNPLTASETETFSLPGDLDGVSSASFDGTNYVFVNSSIGTDGTTETNGGQINGSRISLIAFDENWDVIGGRNLVDRVRIASVEGTNALRNTVNPDSDTGANFLGLVFAEYVLNPETGDYEPDLEAGNDSFIVGNPTFLALESDVAGQTWQERLEASFAPTFNALGNNNFTSFGSISVADTGFRRRGGQAIPFVFSGDGAPNGLAYFHIANGTTVPIEGFGAFAKEQIISAIDFRQTADASGTPFGQTVLLSPEASADDAELYMYVGDRVPGNAGGFADFEDVLYVLQVTDGEGNVVADGTTITEDTELTAQWLLVDGNPLNALDTVPEGKAINTLNAGALSDWVNGADDGVARSTNFANLGGIAEDPNDTGSFYLTSSAGLYNLTFAEDSPTGAGSLTLVQAGDFDSVTVDDDGNVVVQDNAGGSFFYDPEADSLTPFVAGNPAVIGEGVAFELEGISETDDNFNGTGVGAYLTTVNVGDSDGQLLLTTPTAPSRFDSDIFRFQSNITPGTYLFTGGEEAQNIRDNFAESFTEEGLAFTAASQGGEDLIALYRFISNQGTYLFVGEEERAAINADPNFSGAYTEEGLAFYLYGAGSGEGEEFNRFRRTDIPGAYLYAAGDELTTIQTDFTDTYVDEGGAFEAVV